MGWQDGNKTISYMVFGVIPASLWVFGSLILAMARWEMLVMSALMFSAVYALFIAASDNSPAISIKRFLIIAFLILGIKLMLPVTMVYTAGLFYNDFTINNVQLIFMWYFTLCPVIVALHYIMESIFKIVSNK